jgi:hypothetical protein
MLTMYDAAIPQSGMPQFDVVAGYIGSPGATPHVWSQADWDSQAPKYRLPIYVPSWWRTGVWNATADANEAWTALQKAGVPVSKVMAIDFETQVNPNYVSTLVQSLMGRGYYTLMYGSTSSLFLNPAGTMGYWVADPTGTPHLYNHPNVVATQYGQNQSGGHDYDLNVMDDFMTGLLWGGPVALQIPPNISVKWPELAGEFPPNAPYTSDTALIWGDAGARAAALYALQARDAILHLTQMVQAEPQIDVNALAAALAPHLANGATPDQVAAAVVAHLGADLSHG